MKYTPLENAVSFIIGALIAVPICLLAIMIRVDRQMEAMANQKQPVRYIYETVEKEVEVPVMVKVHDTVFIYKDGEEYRTPYTVDDLELIAATVHFEGGNQDDIGKRLIADSILNRMRSRHFPNTVKEVVYQNSNGVYQYAVAKGRFLENEANCCSEEELQIVYEEILKPLDTQVIYFQTGRFSKSGVALYQHGDHYFSGLKEGM